MLKEFNDKVIIINNEGASIGFLGIINGSTLTITRDLCLISLCINNQLDILSNLSDILIPKITHVELCGVHADARALYHTCIIPFVTSVRHREISTSDKFVKCELRKTTELRPNQTFWRFPGKGATYSSECVESIMHTYNTMASKDVHRYLRINYSFQFLSYWISNC